jgi:hypothetical protein
VSGFQRRIERVVRVEILENESPPRSELMREVSNVLLSVKARNHGHAEFELHPSPLEKVDRLPKEREVSGNARGPSVTEEVQGGFHVHGDEVKALHVNETLQHEGVRPIGVEFHQKTMAPDLPDQEREIEVEGRLSSSDADPVNPASKGTETIQDVVDGDGVIALGMEDEGMVVTVGAAKITVGEKENGTDFPGPIDKRGFEEPLDFGHHHGTEIGGPDVVQDGLRARQFLNS